jgi:hypothetical protein
MKHRAITFAFAACLLSSLAFADNPADAALAANGAQAQVAQRDSRVAHNQRRASKTNKSATSTAKNQNGSKNTQPAEQSSPAVLAATNN